MKLLPLIAGPFLITGCTPLVVSLDDDPAAPRLCETLTFPTPEPGGSRLQPCERGKAAVVGFRGYDTIQDAIVDAKDGRTVHICPGPHEGSLLIEGRSLVLAGVSSGAAVVLRGHGGRVLDVVDSRVALQDLSVQGGRDTMGGGIRVVSSDLRLQRVTVRGNHATELGGGLYAEASAVQLVRSSFLDNHALVSGGAIAQVDGCARVERADLHRNQAERHGGAWFYAGQPPSDIALTIEGTHFLRNESGGRGGALAFGGSDSRSELIVHDSQFVANQAGDDGGAIATDGMGENRVDIGHSTFESNATEGRGGAMATVGGLEHVTELNQTLFLGNMAANRGGAVSHHARGPFDRVDVRASDMSGNTAQAGLGIAMTGPPGSLSLTDTSFQGTPLQHSPGFLVFQPSGTLTSLNTVFDSHHKWPSLFTSCGPLDPAPGTDFSCRKGTWSPK